MVTIRSRTAVLAISMMLLSTAPMLAAPAETPDGFVRRVYARYRAKGPDVPTSRPGGAPFYAPALLDLFAKGEAQAKGEVGAIDGDPLCGCQDHGPIQVKSIAISDAALDSAKARVVIRTLGETSTIFLTLLKTPDGWRIADVGDKDTKITVALLQNSIAHSTQDPVPPKP